MVSLLVAGRHRKLTKRFVVSLQMVLVSRMLLGWDAHLGSVLTLMTPVSPARKIRCCCSETTRRVTLPVYRKFFMAAGKTSYSCAKFSLANMDSQKEYLESFSVVGSTSQRQGQY